MAEAQDTFTEASTGVLTSHTADSGHTWTDRDGLADLSVDGATDVCYANASAGVDGHYISAVPASADYTVQAAFRVPNSTSVTPTITGRNSTTQITMYGVRYYASQWELYKWVNNVRSTLGTATDTSPQSAPTTAQLVMAGDQLSVVVGGAAVIGPLTDAAIAAAGRAGIAAFYATASATRYCDTWASVEGGAPAAASLPPRRRPMAHLLVR